MVFRWALCVAWTAVVFIFLAAFSAPAFAAPVPLLDGFQERKLGRDLEFFHDADGALTFDEVARRGDANPWQASVTEAPNLGFTTGFLWARVTLRDERIRPDELALVTPYAPLDEVTVCELLATAEGAASAFACQRAGDHVPRAEWPRPTLHGVFPLAAAREHRLIIRVKDAALQLPLLVRSAPREAEEERFDVALHAGYYALALGLALYNALLWLGTRTTLYGNYVAYTLFFVAFNAAADGSGYATLWRDAHAFNDRAVAFACLACAALVEFFRVLTCGSEGDAGLSPGLRRLAWAILALVPACLLPWPWPMFALVAAIIAAFVPAAIVAARLAWAGERPARLFLLAFSPVVVAALHTALHLTGLVPAPIEITTESILASAAELLLFSYALADRIRSLQASIVTESNRARELAESLAASQTALLQEQSDRNIELAHLDRAKTQFLTNIAHELRTPAHGVLGMTEALERHLGEPARLASDLAVLRRAATRLHDVVSGITAFVASDAREVFAAATPTHLGPILEGVAQSMALDVRPGVALRIDVESDLPLLHADPIALERVLRELLANALKFTSSGAVDVRAVQLDDAVVIQFNDTGAGIEPGAVSSLFQPFEQGDGSITRRSGGLGLGLALAKRAIVHYNATITIESILGRGTTVTVRWPLADEALDAELDALASIHLDVRGVSKLSLGLLAPAPKTDDPIARTNVQSASSLHRAAMPLHSSASPAPSGSSGSSGSKLRLLVVDDDATNRLLVISFLEDLDAECIEAENGAVALSYLSNDGPFDAVLLDVMMPEKSGYEVCRELRATHDSAELPVLLLTAKTLPADIVEGFAAGANDYIPKPFGRAELLARVRTHVAVGQTARVMHHFVPRHALELLGCRDLTGVRLGLTTELNVGVLFADVRGFTELSESAGAGEVFETLNRLYAAIAPCVRHEGGFVDKYIGDAIMAVFPGGAAAACRAAVAMQRAASHVDAGRSLRLGIGVHAGLVHLGTLGEGERFDATVISDVVNVASRLEGATKQLGVSILLSASAARDAGHVAGVQFRPLGAFTLKGRGGAMGLVEVIDETSGEDYAGRLASLTEFAEALVSYESGDEVLAAVRFGALVDADPSDMPAVRYFLEIQRAHEESRRLTAVALETK